MRPRRIRLTVAIVTAGSLLAGAMPSSGADKARVKVSMIVGDNLMVNDFFFGGISSKRPACEKAGRTVKLLDPNGEVATTGVTEEFGEYNVNIPHPHPTGKYRIKAPGNKKCQTGFGKAKFAQG